MPIYSRPDMGPYASTSLEAEIRRLREQVRALDERLTALSHAAAVDDFGGRPAPVRAPRDHDGERPQPMPTPTEFAESLARLADSETDPNRRSAWRMLGYRRRPATAADIAHDYTPDLIERIMP